MSDTNPLNLLKEELENDDVNKHIYNLKILPIDSNKSKCNSSFPSNNGRL